MNKNALKKTKQEDPLIQYAIHEIKLIKNNLNLPSSINYEDLKDLKYWFESDVNFLAQSSIIQIISSYKFYANDTTLLDMEVANDYKIQVFSNAVKEGKITNKGFLIFLIELSIGHLRGVQSTIIKDTPISRYYIPYIPENRILDKIRAKELSSL